ncbi:Tim10/DDP family zinc finger-domain-containing protein [Thelephora terrestris]|uniref:Mitochondrial import inner membrane translocase subunit n=1 Tax=Thelephora terrestris TaxID=56493 RepID=A0A9P6L9Y9_9AGAM|nr:Tim10/DDP family zinc finger-domain-containing protein [Thelephora terrestris]
MMTVIGVGAWKSRSITHFRLLRANMADFLKLNSSTSPTDVEARKEAFKQSLRSELALANAQQLINTTNEKCFAKCVTKPSSSLSGSEETCLARCLDRYMEACALIPLSLLFFCSPPAVNIVSRTYTARLVKERNDNSNNI